MADDSVGSERVTPALTVLRRRKWLIVQTVLFLALATVLFSTWQEPLYQASAEVLLNREDVTAVLTGAPVAISSTDAERRAQTQAGLARAPSIVERVLSRLGLGNRSTRELLDASEVLARPDADLLTFRVRDPNPNLAMRLATTYAEEFTFYRRELDSEALRSARLRVEEQIERLEATGRRGSPLRADLVTTRQQLRTMQALRTPSASLVRPSDRAERVRPRPMRAILLALMLGAVLGTGLAFLAEKVDTRVWWVGEVAGRLGLPVLARVRERRPLFPGKATPLLLRAPNSADAEAIRELRRRVEIASSELGARVIMVSSPVRRQGKARTAVDLAAAFAFAGQHVVLVGLDFRNPKLHKVLKLSSDRPGITEVALREVDLLDALVPIPLQASLAADGGAGALSLLPPGRTPAAISEFVGGPAPAAVLEKLLELFDLVLIDAPPLLDVGDANQLGASVDAVLVVVRLPALRRSALQDLRHALDLCPAPKLGVVARVRETGSTYAAPVPIAATRSGTDGATRRPREETTRAATRRAHVLELNVGEPLQRDGDDASAAEAHEFLHAQLSAGPKPVRDIRRAAEGVGISRQALERAKKQLLVTSVKSGFADGWLWRLPEARESVRRIESSDANRSTRSRRKGER